MEKALSYGNQGALYADVKSALYSCETRPFVQNYIVGLGGREIKTEHLHAALSETIQNNAAFGDDPRWIGLKM